MMRETQEGTVMMTKRYGTTLLALLAVALSITVPRVAAQEVGERVVPTNEVVISGYGTVGYTYRTQGDNANEFNTSVNPISLTYSCGRGAGPLVADLGKRQVIDDGHSMVRVSRCR